MIILGSMQFSVWANPIPSSNIPDFLESCPCLQIPGWRTYPANNGCVMSSGPKLDTTLACKQSVHTCANAINEPFQRPVALLHQQTCQYISFIYKHMKGEENSLPITVYPSLGLSQFIPAWVSFAQRLLIAGGFHPQRPLAVSRENFDGPRWRKECTSLAANCVVAWIRNIPP